MLNMTAALEGSREPDCSIKRESIGLKSQRQLSVSVSMFVQKHIKLIISTNKPKQEDVYIVVGKSECFSEQHDWWPQHLLPCHQVQPSAASLCFDDLKERVLTQLEATGYWSLTSNGRKTILHRPAITQRWAAYKTNQVVKEVKITNPVSLNEQGSFKLQNMAHTWTAMPTGTLMRWRVVMLSQFPTATQNSSCNRKMSLFG